MKRLFNILLLFFWMIGIQSCLISDQKNFEGKFKKELGYRIEGEDVIFEFDLREFEQVSSHWNGTRDFSDLEIKKVAVSGEFNGWSKSGWTMRQVDENIYQLRKKLAEFEDKLEWEYKFIINEAFWVEPPDNALNRRQDWDSHNNLVLNTARPRLKGNTTFRLKDFPNAQRIFLAGSFNHWNPSELLFGKENDEWICRIDLSEGKYAYKFVVDGKWMTDPDNRLIENDREGNLNSILFIGKPALFTLKGYANAKKVVLSGSFNNWDESQYVCQKINNQWQFSLPLPKGIYEYKFIVDGKWITDPDNPFQRTTAKGYVNSILTIQK